MTVVKIPGCKLSTIAISDIHEGERFREDYGDLTDLCHSIKTHGLINPIAVAPSSGPTKYILVAGGRRLRACQQLEMASVPVRIFTGDVSELDLRILELAENIQRKDMTWQESNRLQREIHKLQQEKFGVPTPGNISSDGWRMEDTAAMLGVSRAKVGDAIKLTEQLEAYASVLGDPGKFKTENDARKAVKRVEEAMMRVELAKRAEKRASSNSFAQKIIESYQIGDCLDAMSQMPDEMYDFCEVDPPYGIDLDVVKRNNDCEGYNEISQDEYLVETKKILSLCYAKLKQNTYCLYWFGIDPWLEYIYKIAREVGFKGSRIPLIWTKPNGQSLNPNQNLATCYETAFVFRKGQPMLAKPGRSNIFSFSPEIAENKYHPTQKPLDLYQEIYQTFSFENAKCLVPFAGSGASLLAAYTTKRQAIGFDLTTEYKGGFIQSVNSLFLTDAQTGE